MNACRLEKWIRRFGIGFICFGPIFVETTFGDNQYFYGNQNYHFNRGFNRDYDGGSSSEIYEERSNERRYFPERNIGGYNRDVIVPSRAEHPHQYRIVMQRERRRIKEHGNRFWKLVDVEMGSNDGMIEEAKKTGNIIEEFLTRGKVIKRSGKAVGSAERMMGRTKFWENNFEEYEGKLKKQTKDYSQKAQEYNNYKKHIQKELKFTIRKIGEKYEEFERDMSSNENQIKAADATNDFYERLRVRGDLMGKSEDAARFSERYIEAVNELKKESYDKKNDFEKINLKHHKERSKNYRNHQKEVGQNFHDIEGDVINREFRNIHEGMSGNDVAIERADETHDLYIRLNVRKEIIEKSEAAAQHLEKYINMANGWQGKAYENVRHHPEWNLNNIKARAKIYRDYKEKVEKEIPAIEEDIRTKERVMREEQERAEQQRREEEEYKRKEKERKRKEQEEKERQKEEKRKKEEAEKESRRQEKERKRKEEEERQKREAEEAEMKKQKEEDSRKNDNKEGTKENEGEKSEDQTENGGMEEDEDVEYFEVEIGGEQFKENLENFDSIFNGNKAPSMERFDRLMETVLGGKGDGQVDENGNVDYGGNLDEGRETDVIEDVGISSYEYRDEKYGVEMDIGRVFRAKKDQFDFDVFDDLSDDVMSLSGINVLDGGNELVLALNNGIERILIKSDLNSLENYIAQRMVEDQMNLRPRPPGEGNIDPENLKFWGLDGSDVILLRKIGSAIADFLPYLGTSKSINELIYGYDYIAGEEVSRVVAAFAVAGSLLPVPGAVTGIKFVGKWTHKLIKNGAVITKKMPTKFHVRTMEETAALRKEFYPNVRAKFLRQYSYSKNAKKKFSESELEILKMGELPEGWIVHHKIPLFRGGNNNFDNLRIMKKIVHDKYRQRLHFYKKGDNIYDLD
ncbi:MAG: hypothetical protein C5B43_04490 [Verrucomicrobia bacterium]|nr:MAG: hypothetical protein C5B43_04490 [Verrucomicrobiota bacterium]